MTSDRLVMTLSVNLDLAGCLYKAHDSMGGTALTGSFSSNLLLGSIRLVGDTDNV
jgi:hypothetical protein